MKIIENNENQTLKMASTVEPRYSVPRNSDFPRYSDFFAADQFLMY